jgi:hypothetical protein
MEANFNWNDVAPSPEGRPSPARHGDGAGHSRRPWNEGWDWGEGASRTLYRGGVSAWRSGPDRAQDVAVDASALRMLIEACEGMMRAWQGLLGLLEDETHRAACVVQLSGIDQEMNELDALLIAADDWDGVADPRAARRTRLSDNRWRESKAHGLSEALTIAVLRQRTVIEKYESVLAGSPSQSVRRVLGEHVSRASMRLEDVRSMLAHAFDGTKNQSV